MLSIWKVTKQTIFGVARISRSLRAPMSSRAGKLLTAIAFWTFVAAVPAVADTFTLDWAGGYWNDGGGLAGTFTIEYDDSTGRPRVCYPLTSPQATEQATASSGSLTFTMFPVSHPLSIPSVSMPLSMGGPGERAGDDGG